jgi:hypothetical protein
MNATIIAIQGHQKVSYDHVLLRLNSGYLFWLCVGHCKLFLGGRLHVSNQRTMHAECGKNPPKQFNRTLGLFVWSTLLHSMVEVGQACPFFLL